MLFVVAYIERIKSYMECWNIELENYIYKSYRTPYTTRRHMETITWPMRLYVSCSPVLWRCILVWRNPKEQTTGLDLRTQATQGSMRMHKMFLLALYSVQRNWKTPYFNYRKLSTRRMEKDSWKHPHNQYGLSICVFEASTGMNCGKGMKGVKTGARFWKGAWE